MPQLGGPTNRFFPLELGAPLAFFVWSALPGQIECAIIGDYGWNPNPSDERPFVHETKLPAHNNQYAAKVVANMVNGWNPMFIISVGDDSYWCRLKNSFDANVGPFYAKYIYPYKGTYNGGQGSKD